MTLARADLSLENMISDPRFNFLNSINDNNDDDTFLDSPYDTSLFNTSYCEPVEFARKISNNNSLSFMTFNIQSISAKFSDFCELISLFNDSNCSPDVICLQELWQFSPFMNLSLNGYHPLCYKLRNNAQGGGVGIYVKNHLQFKVLHECSIFMDRILESLFIEIALPNNSKFIIGTLYRPGATHPTLTPQELFHEFIELFSNLLDNISDRSNLIILGDFNLDVLQFSSNNKCSDYVDLLFSFGLLQLVTRPT